MRKKKLLYSGVASLFSELSKPEYDPFAVTRKEELALIKEAKSDEKAFRVFIKRNMRFAARLAKKYMGGSEHDMDIFNAGVIGLITALRRFDCDRSNIKYISYAVHWVRMEIIRCLRGIPMVSLTCHMAWRAKKVDEIIDNLKKAGHEHADEEVSREIGLGSKTVANARMARRTQYTIDYYPGYSHGYDCRAEEPGYYAATVEQFKPLKYEDICPVDALSIAEDKQRLRNAISRLDGDEAMVINKLYFEDEGVPRSPHRRSEGPTLREVAEKTGYCYEKVRQIRDRAFGKIALMFAQRALNN